MEKYYEMVAVQQRDGQILLTTLKGSHSFWVNGKDAGVILGDMVKVTMDPIEFVKIENPDIKFDVFGKRIQVEDHHAVIILENNRYYFDSPIFGNMNNLGVIAQYVIGTSQLVRISYRAQENRSNDMRFQWDAHIDYATPISKTDLNSGKPIREYGPFTVEGIVIAKNEERNYFYVWNIELYAGRYIHLYPKSGVNLEVSDWVRMHFTELHYEMCFPLDAKPETPQCESILYVKIEPRLKTIATRDNRSVMITIPNFVKSGETLYHHIFGYLRDDEEHIKENGEFEITVTRRSPNDLSGGEVTSWCITKATKLKNENSISRLDEAIQKLAIDNCPSPSLPRAIDGIIVAKNDRSNCYFVWTKESYPGRDVKLWNNMGIDLKVSDWVRMNLTDAEFERYFPLEPTRQFECRSFTKIEAPLRTVPTRNNNSVMVTISNFVSTGDPLYHPLLGYLRDDQNLLTDNATFNITVARRAPTQTLDGRSTVWHLIKAQKLI